MRSVVVSLAASAALAFSVAQAAIVDINIWQDGDDVVFQAAGEVDYGGSSSRVSGTSNIGYVNASSPFFWMTDDGDSSRTYRTFSGGTRPSPIGTGQFFRFDRANAEYDSSGADAFGIFSGGFWIDSDYVENSDFSISMRVLNRTLADLGIVGSSQTFNVAGTTFNLDTGVAPAAVPVPGALALFAPALAGAAFARRKRAA